MGKCVILLLAIGLLVTLVTSQLSDLSSRPRQGRPDFGTALDDIKTSLSSLDPKFCLKYAADVLDCCQLPMEIINTKVFKTCIKENPRGSSNNDWQGNVANVFNSYPGSRAKRGLLSNAESNPSGKGKTSTGIKAKKSKVVPKKVAQDQGTQEKKIPAAAVADAPSAASENKFELPPGFRNPCVMNCYFENQQFYDTSNSLTYFNYTKMKEILKPVFLDDRWRDPIDAAIDSCQLFISTYDANVVFASPNKPPNCDARAKFFTICFLKTLFLGCAVGRRTDEKCENVRTNVTNCDPYYVPQWGPESDNGDGDNVEDSSTMASGTKVYFDKQANENVVLSKSNNAKTNQANKKKTPKKPTKKTQKS